MMMMSIQDETLESLRSIVAGMPADAQLRVAQAHKQLAGVVAFYGELGPIALTLLGLEIEQQLDKE